MKLAKTYEPGEYESDIYALWEKSNAFTPQGSEEPYSLVVPPPNANGDLHIGHALTLAVEDIAARYHRLKGERTLYVPGADHAGFETWVVYEKQLAKQGKSRFDFTREQLYSQVWDFVAQNRSNFEKQIRRLGASVDWRHFTFTLDPKIVRQAYRTFKQMWDEGLIYRGERIVNFCTFHGTSFADIEVNHKEEKGKLYYIAFPLADKSGEVMVATVRPETVVGQAGLMVNPKDKRYKDLIGAIVNQPLVPDAPVKIVAEESVDPNFGTGVVTITPGHSAIDYEVARKHNLPVIELITPEGKMSANVPEAFRGMTVLEARKAVTAALETAGYLRKTEGYTHTIGVCYKCGTVIEPLLREQWFVDMQPLAGKAVKALEAGEITFYPDSKREQLIKYLKNLKDWNISRQIAWGIPIPAFQNVDEPSDWIYDERVEEEILEIEDSSVTPGQLKTYRRDPDVFDTWFSSGSWPYATLDFPGSEDFKDFYPLSLMETGGEILYPWVSRMIMMGVYTTGKIPFEKVYIHGYVMAKDGSKMSKSIGNVINPDEVLQQYGSDALRMGIIAGRVPAVNRGYDSRKVEEARNFCNKVWNVARFAEDKLGEDFKYSKHLDPKTAADHWILLKLKQTIDNISTNLDNYRFSEAYEQLYHFIWDDFADWYIEASKSQDNPNVLAHVLESSLILLHPFAPFLTETIWQTLGWQGSLLVNSRWPETVSVDAEQSQNFEDLKNIITEVRYLRAALKLKSTELHYIAPQFVADNTSFIEKLTSIKTITEVQLSPGLRLINTPYKCWLDIDNKTLENYKKELAGKKKAQESVVAKLEQRLANPDYVAKAPEAVRNQSQQQLEEAQNLLATIVQETKRFEPAETVKPQQAAAKQGTETAQKSGPAAPAQTEKPQTRPPEPPKQS